MIYVLMDSDILQNDIAAPPSSMYVGQYLGANM